MRLQRKLAGVVLLVAGLASGCGGDDKQATTDPGTGPTLTKAQYVTAADKVCQATTDKITAAAENLRESAKKTGTIPIPEVTKFLTKTSLPAYEAMLGELRGLTPPKGDEKTIDGLIAALAGAIDTAKADPVKYSRNGAPDPFDDANARAINYGMKVCGS